MLEDMNDKKWVDDENYKSYKENTPMLFPKL